MVPDAATTAVLLQVLDRHLKSKPHERAEITTSSAKYEIASSVLDLSVGDAASPPLAARLILTVREISGPGGARDQPAIELPAHIFTTTSTTTPSPDQPATTPSSASIILDEIPQPHHGASPPPPPPPLQRASAIPTHPLPADDQTTTTTTARPPLAETYRAYLSAFMTPSPPAASASASPLARFLHDPAVHNGRALSAPEYHRLGGAVREAVPDLRCEVAGLVADEARQVVAARLEFTGALAGPGGPGPARAAGGGRDVSIGEIVFYWFDGGRIREVVSLVDLGVLGELSRG